MTVADSEPSRGELDLDRLAEEFLERYRRGEWPSIEEYTAAYPELADDIRDLFPALVEVERVKASSDGPVDPSGSLGPPLTRIGDYLILGIIGQGAMGIVYEAVRESLRNRVALKIMHPRYRDHDRYLRRFHVEAKAAARLHHTNIVSVFDYGEADGFVYYAMPLIIGQSLERVLEDVRRLRGEETRGGADTRPAGSRAGPTPFTDTARTPRSGDEIAKGLLSGRLGTDEAPTQALSAWAAAGIRTELIVADDMPRGAPSAAVPEARATSGVAPGPPSSLAEQSDNRYHREVARLGAQAADALAYAHKRGVLHRDIKPSNLMLDALGNVWVTDFGLAKLEDGDDLSRSTDVVGTLRYMSPERFQGISSQSGDTYALGATLYELLTLEPVFDERDQFGLIARITHVPPVPPRELDRRIPRDLETIILKALAKDPKDRFAGADELAAELRRFVENRPIRSRTVPGYELFWRWCKRNPSLAAVNALAAALTVAIAVIASYSAVALKAQRDEAHHNLVRAYTSEIAAHYSAAEGYRLSRRVAQRFGALDEVASAVSLGPAVGGLSQADRLRLRNAAIGAMALPDFRVDREIDISWAKLRSGGPTFNSDLSRFAVTLVDGTVSVRRVADGHEEWRLPGIAPDTQDRTSSFSADGRYVAMSARDHTVVQIWDLTTGRLVLLDEELCKSNVRAWDFRPCGRELAVGHADGSIAFYELPSGRLLRRWQPRLSGVGTIAFSPDGSRIAYGYGGSSKVVVCESDSGRLLAELPHPDTIFHVAWNPRKPDVIAAGCEDSVIYVWNINTREHITVLRGTPYNGLVVAFHPGGELLASRGWDAILRLWDTRTGQQVLTRQSNWGPDLFYSRDGRRLAGERAGSRVRILEASEGDCRSYVARPFDASDVYAGVAIDDSGRYLAASSSSSVGLWDLKSGTYLAAIPNGGDHLKRLAFDPSGALVVTAPWTLRWPVRAGPGESGSIGPPEFLAPYRAKDVFSMSRDGSVIAVPRYQDGAVVFDVNGQARPRHLFPQKDVRAVSVSPDGRWAVTGTHSVRDGMRLWDVRTGRLVHAFPEQPRHVCWAWTFSPDGRWLLASGDEGLVLIDVATGKTKVGHLSLTFAGAVFSPDSRMIALVAELGSVALLDVDDGHELARLEDPEQVKAAYLAFSRDGSSLAVSIHGPGAVRVWDLRSIRRRLAGMGLDWQPEASQRSDTAHSEGDRDRSPQPFRIDRGALDEWLKNRRCLEHVLPAGFRAELETHPASVDGLHHRAHLLASLGRHEEAIGDYSSSLAQVGRDAHLFEWRAHSRLAVGDYDLAATDMDEVVRLSEGDDEVPIRIANILNAKAWSLASSPASGPDARKATALARRAVALSRNNHAYLNTLCLALYREGAFAEAVAVLEDGSSAGEEREALDLMFLAMAHHRMGHMVEARDRLESALRWRREHPDISSQGGELDRFEAEARGVLSGPFPEDVFAPVDRRDAPK